jgi:membrane protein DedA with SNARE-associated domain
MQPAEDRPASKRHPQFTLAALLGIMVVVSVTLAPAYYLSQAARGGTRMQLVGMIFLLVAPMGLVIVASLAVWTLAKFRGIKRRDAP